MGVREGKENHKLKKKKPQHFFFTTNLWCRDLGTRSRSWFKGFMVVLCGHSVTLNCLKRFIFLNVVTHGYNTLKYVFNTVTLVEGQGHNEVLT